MSLLRLPNERRERILAYALALVTSAATLAIVTNVGALRDPPLALIASTCAVAVAAALGGFWPGMLATVTAAAGTAILLMPPMGQASVVRPVDALALALFMTAGTTASILSGRIARRVVHERQFRSQTERQIHQANRLHELTAALSRAQSAADLADACVHEIAYGMGSAGALVALAGENGEWAEVVKAIGYHRDLASPLQPFSLSTASPLTDAMRTQEPVVIGSAAARLREYPHIVNGHFLAAHPALAVFPLVRGRKALGVIGVSFVAPRSFSDDEMRYLTVAADRMAHALERAQRQHTAERAREEAETFRARANQELIERQKIEEALRESEAKYRSLATRTSRLHSLTGALSEAVTLGAVARAVVRQGKVVAGATGGSVVLLAGEGRHFETLYVEDHAHQSVEAAPRFTAEPGLCATEAVETRAPVFVRSFAEWQQRFWRSAPLAADAGYSSAATLPLVVENAVIGVLSFHFTAPVNFDEQYAALLTSVAQHAAQALDRARLYESAQRARASAEAASRMKDDFLSTVSHELRAPLNAILGWASMLRTGKLDAARTTRATEAIVTSASRQAALIDDLLDGARIVAGRATLDVHELDLADIVRGAVESIMPSAEAKGVTVSFAAVPPAGVKGDARRLEQVFLNLLSNGVKFTPQGGRVDVDLHVIDHTVRVRVADTGIGIASEFLPHVFERFRQADSSTARRYGGLGLGLSIAHHLVTLHGGTIEVDSPGPDRGAAFTVTLPAHDERRSSLSPMAVLSPPLPETNAPHLDGVRVMVVDDESDTRELMTWALERCGATVLPAASSHDALEALQSTDVDVLLADIAMPHEDGYTLIRRLRSLTDSRNAHIPAAAVTACVRDDERREAFDAGFQMHVQKPIDPAALAERVAELLRASA